LMGVAFPILSRFHVRFDGMSDAVYLSEKE